MLYGIDGDAVHSGVRGNKRRCAMYHLFSVAVHPHVRWRAEVYTDYIERPQTVVTRYLRKELSCAGLEPRLLEEAHTRPRRAEVTGTICEVVFACILEQHGGIIIY
jgi:hypothetical protein